MSFNPPNTFNFGFPLEAPDLQENSVALRDYLASDIIEGDLDTDTFSTYDVQEGEAVSITNDFIFMTGDVYSGYYAAKSSTPSERQYHTSTVKRFKPMEKVRYQSIPPLAKQFYMEDNGDALVEVSFFVSDRDGDSCRGAYFPWIPSPPVGSSRHDGQDSQYILAIDGSITAAVAETKGYSFEENGANTITFGAFSVMNGENGYQGGVTGQRKFVTILFLAKNLQQGWHQIAVLKNPCCEMGYIGSRTIQVEVFYDMGYNPTTPNSLATNRKLPETIY